LLWLPRVNYRPIGPNERWTVQSGLVSFKFIGTGRAALTPADPKAATDPFAANPNDVTPARPAITPAPPQPLQPAPTPVSGSGGTVPSPSPTPVESSPTPVPTSTVPA
jgi:hypothetical protein